MYVGPLLETKSRRNIKIGRKVFPYHGWHCAPLPRSKVKVITSLKSVTEGQPYLRNGNAYLLQTWYTDRVRWSTSPTCAVTSKVRDARSYCETTLSELKSRTVSELKFALQKIWDNFPHVQLKKAVPVPEIVWQEYVEDIVSIFLYWKSVHTYSVCAVLNSLDNFW